jgi:hypothetical protein
MLALRLGDIYGTQVRNHCNRRHPKKFAFSQDRLLRVAFTFLYNRLPCINICSIRSKRQQHYQPAIIQRQHDGPAATKLTEREEIELLVFRLSSFLVII